MFPRMITDPQKESRAAFRARMGRESAARSRAWRARQREQLVPDSRAAAGAIAEAVSFLVQRNLKNIQSLLPGASGPSMTIAEIVDAASICLRRDGYHFTASRRRVVEMLQPRSAHNSGAHVPTTAAVPGPAVLIPPRGADRWTAAELQAIRRVMNVGHAATIYDAIAADGRVLRDTE